jgi:hypothetical protein
MRDAFSFNPESLIESSPLLKSIKRFSKKNALSRVFGNDTRPLTKKEITALVQHGNIAQNWNKISVHNGFIPDRVRNNTFLGACVLGVYSANRELTDFSMRLPSGIFGSILQDSEIGDECGIWNSGIAGYVINEKTLVYHVGCLACSPKSSFGNGAKIVIGNETGGREVFSFAEMTLALANAISGRRHDTKLLSTYNTFIEHYVARCTIGLGIVESDCRLTNTNKIIDAYIGKNTIIDAATAVCNCTILGSREEPVLIESGALVENSCMQWGSRVASMAIVEGSLLLEHSHVERHGKVRSSIIGPNTGIAEGEVTSSLVGPFVGFHHQALLIGALWPEGKGNIGYGANVGSNHTGKAPDQEIFCGEGAFFGLGVNVKFPADFSRAPYTFIATGVTTLPQKFEFPFSLINTPSRALASLSPAYNEAFPGWVLIENSYALKRNEAKFEARNEARRTEITFSVLRPEIIDMIVSARNRLKNISRKARFYTAKEIAGLGKNFLFEKSRLAGIAAYNLYIEYYCLKGLFVRLSGSLKKNGARFSYSAATENSAWEHERTLIIQEGFSKRSVIENLSRLKDLERTIAQSVQKAKEKDDARGERIIPDYRSTHAPASQDYFIKQTWDATRRTLEDIETLIKKL